MFRSRKRLPLAGLVVKSMHVPETSLLPMIKHGELEQVICVFCDPAELSQPVPTWPPTIAQPGWVVRSIEPVIERLPGVIKMALVAHEDSAEFIAAVSVVELPVGVIRV
jgi:hypothetical protein